MQRVLSSLHRTSDSFQSQEVVMMHLLRWIQIDRTIPVHGRDNGNRTYLQRSDRSSWPHLLHLYWAATCVRFRETIAHLGAIRLAAPKAEQRQTRQRGMKWSMRENNGQSALYGDVLRKLEGRQIPLVRIKEG